MAYDPDPRYPLSGGSRPICGYPALTEQLTSSPGRVVALDGPASLPWGAIERGLRVALQWSPVPYDIEYVEDRYVDWGSFEDATESDGLRDDPDFARIPSIDLELLIPRQNRVRPVREGEEILLLLGPGAALVEHDEAWLLEHTREEAARLVRAGEGRNLGQVQGGEGTWRRLAFIDWPLMERHWARILPGVNRYVDVTEPDRPRSLAMSDLRANLRALAHRPFRTRPTAQPGVWGGQWLKRLMGVTDVPNLAWSYELIAPESDVSFGVAEPVRVNLGLMLAEASRDILGDRSLRRFGRSFPIRMDYLDTMDGAPLSAHCHPQWRYASSVFGLPYTQHESYYVMKTRTGSRIYLGLQEHVDIAAFRHAVEAAESDSTPFALDTFAASHIARQHQIYLIPAGTIHASGQNNVVLEISSTPYLYSLRFYDWLRQDSDGNQRSVRPDHAFANLDPAWRGRAIGELIPTAIPLRKSNDGIEEELGRLEEVALHIRRLTFKAEMADDTDGGFHVLNLVEGSAVQIQAADGSAQRLSYAETALVPACVGPYRLAGDDSQGPFKVVKAVIAP